MRFFRQPDAIRRPKTTKFLPLLLFFPFSSFVKEKFCLQSPDNHIERDARTHSLTHALFGAALEVNPEEALKVAKGETTPGLVEIQKVESRAGKVARSSQSH